jgi:hypothetical protein
MKEERTQSKEEWSQIYGKRLSQGECKEICDNLCGFFSVLRKWNDNENEELEDERNRGLRNSNNPSQA